ncbi:hypothetical protein F6Y05_40370 [Bacillus megaterium]|nr:hypothetical protein [Priestia megaterium]
MFPGLRKNLVGWFNDMVKNVKEGISGTTGTDGTNAGKIQKASGNDIGGTW